MTSRSRAIAAMLTVFSTIPVFAQVSAQERNDRLQIAQRLARVLNPHEGYRERLRTMYAGMTPMFAQAAEEGQLPEDFADKMSKVMEEVMPYESFTRMFAEEYAAHFTAEELNDMLRFYTSPTGEKMLSLSSTVGAEIMRKMTDQMMPKMQEALRRQGLIK